MMHAVITRKPRVSPYWQRDQMALVNAALMGVVDALLDATAGGQSLPYRKWLRSKRGRDEAERQVAAALGCEVRELRED